jgi:hypothetical protein
MTAATKGAAAAKGILKIRNGLDSLFTTSRSFTLGRRRAMARFENFRYRLKKAAGGAVRSAA